MTEQGSPSRFTRIVDILTLLGVLVATALLIEQRFGDRANRAASAVVEDASASALPAGTKLQEVSVSDSVGTRTNLFTTSDSTATLVYVFKTACAVCAQQKPEWLEIAGRARSRGWRVAAVTSETLVPWVRHYFPPNVATLRLADPVQASEVLGIRAVPTTIAVDGSGRVLSYHVGRMSREASDSLRKLIEDRARVEER